MLRRAIASVIAAFIAHIALPALADASAHAHEPYQEQRGHEFSGPIEVSWGGFWYAAEIRDVHGDSFLINYTGWSSTFDEWVGSDRIRHTPSAYNPRVQILWGGSWYPGFITKQDGGRYLVSYDGWSSFFDEWVDDSRLRFDSPVYVPTQRPQPTFRPTHHFQKPTDKPVHERPTRPNQKPRRPNHYVR